jgi:hypothetical protein
LILVDEQGVLRVSLFPLRSHWPDLSDQRQAVVIYEFYEVPMAQPKSTAKK